MIKYIALASSIFCLSNISVASDSDMKIDKDSFSSEEKSFGSTSTKMFFSLPEKYQPEDQEHLTRQDVLALIHEGDFDFDESSKKTYIQLLGEYKDETTFSAYQELKAFYEKTNQKDLALEVSKKLVEFNF